MKNLPSIIVSDSWKIFGLTNLRKDFFLQFEGHVSFLSDGRFVGHDDDRFMLFMSNFLENGNNILSRFFVQVPSWFICDDDVMPSC